MMSVARLQAQSREIAARMRATTDHPTYERLARLWMGLQKQALRLAIQANPALSGEPEAEAS